LGCAFCQNRQVSQGGGLGAPVSDAEFAAICLALAEKGAENINIVTGSHAIPALVNGIAEAKTRGLAIPVLWNSSGYESAAGLSLLENCVDVYLPDLKTLDSDIGGCFFRAPDYGEAASAAILKMIEARPEARFRGDVLISGVVIRHLVLPGRLDSTRQVIRWFSENASGYALLSLMMQYTPVGDAPNIPQRCISEEEYETVLDWLDEFGIEDGFYQELVPDNEWLPDFNRANPFSSELSTPVWHWKEGFVKV
jgi:putative pyruvate formate lyase activating enzyme